MVIVWVLVLLLLPVNAAAQTTGSLTGLFTGFAARGTGDDVEEDTWTPGVSLAVIGHSGVGSEIDFWQLRDINPARFTESRVTAFFLNATGVWPDGGSIVRPYILGGIGILRSRVCAFTCEQAISETSLGIDAGAGTFVIWNELVGARADVRYVRFLQTQDVFPLDPEGGYFSYWRASVGVTISWPLR